MDLEFKCVTWAGWTQPNNGYGRFRVDGEQKMVHRWAYECQYGEIPEGMTIDHLCFNRACIEPTHLRVVTRAENGSRHQPNCRCPAHNEGLRITSLERCSNGHDLRAPGAITFPASRPRGRCRQCMVDADKRRKEKNKLPPHRAFATAG